MPSLNGKQFEMGIEKIEIKPLYKLLDHLLERPYFYDITSVSDLYHFYNGYETALIANAIEDEELTEFKKGFSDFLKTKYDDSNWDNWAGIITRNSESDLNSLELFASFLNEFRN